MSKVKRFTVVFEAEFGGDGKNNSYVTSSPSADILDSLEKDTLNGFRTSVYAEFGTGDVVEGTLVSITVEDPE